VPLSMTEPGFTPLFDGVSLTGWRAIPRTYGRMYPGGPRVLDVVTDFPADYNEQAEAHPAVWTIEDGAIVRDAAGKAAGLRGDDPATTVEPFTATKRAMLTRSAVLETFLATWRFGDWNEFRIRCVGGLPLVTVWINDLLVAEIDLGTLQAPNYAPDKVSERLGRRGHIALEVHDTDPMLGERRWGRNARCRWRNIRIREL
jgi:3-keto-disaccharide hydrolase